MKDVYPPVESRSFLFLLLASAMLVAFLILRSSATTTAFGGASTTSSVSPQSSEPYQAAIAPYESEPVEQMRSAQPTEALPIYELEEIETDLATLQPELDFTVWRLHELPQGAGLSSVHKIVNPGPNGGLGVKLTYMSAISKFTIIESNPKLTVKGATSSGAESPRTLRTVDINGHQGKIYDPGGPEETAVENRAILTWRVGTIWFEMRSSNAGYEEMVRIARALAP